MKTSTISCSGWLAGSILLCTLALHCAVVRAGDLPTCARTFTLAYHDHGMLYSKATDQGIDKDVALEMIKRSGCKFEVSLMPRARIWLRIESGQLDFSMSGITNDTRDKFASFAWYLYNKYYFIVRKDANVVTLAEFEKDTRLRLGAIRSFRYSKKVNEMVDQLTAQQRITEASEHQQLLNMMRLNRIQGMIIEPFNFSQVENLELNDLTRILDSGDPPVLHGLIISRKSIPEGERQKWHAIIDGMHRDGTMLQILLKYFPRELARSMVAL